MTSARRRLTKGYMIMRSTGTRDQKVLNERFGSLDTALWLYGFYPTKDGGVFLGGLRLEMWKAFVDIIGKYDEWGAAEWTSLAPFMKKDWQLKYQGMIDPLTAQYTSEELTQKSIQYAKTGRLAPITPVVAEIMSPLKAMQDPNWLERGIFTPVQDPVYGSVICAQSQWKATETPPRTKWVCRPVGYDNPLHIPQVHGYRAATIESDFPKRALSDQHYFLKGGRAPPFFEKLNRLNPGALFKLIVLKIQR